MNTNIDEDKIIDIAHEIYFAAQLFKHRGEGVLDGVERISNILTREIFAEATGVNTQETGQNDTLETLLEAARKPVRLDAVGALDGKLRCLQSLLQQMNAQDAATAIGEARSALPAQQEPSAWMVRNPSGCEWPQREKPKVVPPGWSCYPLYRGASEVSNEQA
ncbi:hypothetical protein [Xanthomonas sp. MUS 060]|uniref:hypothetical protein n=1 Tax=Xanthomonas sp. MUS 060 TaxID=1588031 RepID=UPI0005F27A57|nr:hypothetical protein [Xanthomonas sp. MUS 060]